MWTLKAILPIPLIQFANSGANITLINCSIFIVAAIIVYICGHIGEKCEAYKYKTIFGL